MICTSISLCARPHADILRNQHKKSTVFSTRSPQFLLTQMLPTAMAECRWKSAWGIFCWIWEFPDSSQLLTRSNNTHLGLTRLHVQRQGNWGRFVYRNVFDCVLVDGSFDPACLWPSAVACDFRMICAAVTGLCGSDHWGVCNWESRVQWISSLSVLSVSCGCCRCVWILDVYELNTVHLSQCQDWRCWKCGIVCFLLVVFSSSPHFVLLVTTTCCQTLEWRRWLADQDVQMRRTACFFVFVLTRIISFQWAVTHQVDHTGVREKLSGKSFKHVGTATRLSSSLFWWHVSWEGSVRIKVWMWDALGVAVDCSFVNNCTDRVMVTCRPSSTAQNWSASYLPQRCSVFMQTIGHFVMLKMFWLGWKKTNKRNSNKKSQCQYSWIDRLVILL